MFLTLRNPNLLSIMRVSLFIFFPPLHIWHAGTGPGGFETSSSFLIPLTTASAVIISMVTRWKSLAAFKAGRTTNTSRRNSGSFFFFLPHFRLFSGHHLFNYIVSPLLASTHVLPTHIKNETDRMLFLRPIYMLMKNASQFQKKADVCRQTGWIRTHPACPGWKERRLATCPACHFPFPLSLTRP